jgi:hypothetical protein
MLATAKRSWIKRLGLGAAAALAIGTVALSSAPAEARVFVSVGVPFGLPYYAPPPAFYYPAPIAYGGCGWGWHWAPPHWNRWGRWVPGHCRPNY